LFKSGNNNHRVTLWYCSGPLL